LSKGLSIVEFIIGIVVTMCGVATIVLSSIGLSRG
jgi:hypothetical protein